MLSKYLGSTLRARNLFSASRRLGLDIIEFEALLFTVTRRDGESTNGNQTEAGSLKWQTNHRGAKGSGM